jgi:hypothetical protein
LESKPGIRVGEQKRGRTVPPLFYLFREYCSNSETITIYFVNYSSETLRSTITGIVADSVMGRGSITPKGAQLSEAISEELKAVSLILRLFVDGSIVRFKIPFSETNESHILCVL